MFQLSKLLVPEKFAGPDFRLEWQVTFADCIAGANGPEHSPSNAAWMKRETDSPVGVSRSRTSGLLGLEMNAILIVIVPTALPV